MSTGAENKEKFNYHRAFERNLGWITPEEAQILRNSRVAIGGMGGVGGTHFLTLVRLGVGKFHIADLDNFELANFNRQAGANITTLGESKVQTLKQMALDINPELEITTFDKGITEDNIDLFLKDVDLYIDSLDLFVQDLREVLFKRLWELKIPAVNVGPMGMSSAMINFIPKKGNMSFADYFGTHKAKTQLEKVTRFVLGVAPSLLHRPHIIDPSRVDLATHLVPSTPMGINIASAICATEAMKILLKRGHVLAAPFSVQIDAYGYKMKKRWMPFGYRNPIMLLKMFFVRRLVKKMTKETDKRRELEKMPKNMNQNGNFVKI
ncbi:MAG: ThiF family adenylyltransferase [Halobacteriovoraceae bacterium]|nr:ThiF family adenylyltransferase [Halobacteriovoraceae bacterium]